VSDHPFDPQWTTDNPALMAYLDSLCADLTATETGKGKRKIRCSANL